MAGRRHCGVLSPDYKVEFHETVTTSISTLIKGYTDRGDRWSIIRLVDHWENHGDRKYCDTTDSDYEVGFREIIAGMIQSLIEWIENEHEYYRRRSVNLIGNLINRGEC